MLGMAHGAVLLGAVQLSVSVWAMYNCTTLVHGAVLLALVQLSVSPPRQLQLLPLPPTEGCWLHPPPTP